MKGEYLAFKQQIIKRDREHLLIIRFICRGHYFQTASLPPRSRYGSPPKTRHGPSSQLHHTSSISADPPSDVPTHFIVSPNGPIVNNVVPSIPAAPVAQQQPSSHLVVPSQDVSHKPAKETESTKVPMRLSGVVVEQRSRARSRAHSPRLALQSEGPSGRPLIVKPASPPYSPESELRRTNQTHSEDGDTTGHLDDTTDILTPRRDDQDAVPSSAKGSIQDQFESADESYGISRPLNNDGETSLHAQDLAQLPVDRAFSTSPTTTSRSAHTARTTAQSPVTSPDEDLSRLNPQAASVDASMSTEVVHGGYVPAITPDAHGRELSDITSSQIHAIGTDGKLTSTLEVVQNMSELGSRHVSLQQSSNLSRSQADSGSAIVDIVMEDAIPLDQSVHEKSMRSLSNGSLALPIEISLPEKDHVTSAISTITETPGPLNCLSHSPTFPALKRAQTSHRVQKARVNRKDRKLHVILSRPLDDEYITLVRNIRKDQSYLDEDPLSYLRAAVQNQVLADENMTSLDHLLMRTSKSVTTSDFMTSIREEQDLRVVERAGHLQGTQRWSFRQIKASPEPTTPVSHWDGLLKDVKWLRTDYREERKLKVACAKKLILWCAAWVSAEPSERLAMQVNVRPTLSQSIGATQMQVNGIDHIASGKIGYKFGAGTKPDEVEVLEDLFSSLSESTAARVRLNKCLLESLPSYGSVKPHFPKSIRALRDVVESEDFERKLEQAKVTRAETDQPTIDTASNEEGSTAFALAPEEMNCALFNPEARPLRARLNAPWIFKPPTAMMPPQNFYEYRSASQWSWEDDGLLKQYTKDFPSNWPLIADRMAPKSSFNSYMERRTPWECYERLLATDGPPADAQARQYLRHFSYRIEKARESFDKHQTVIREQAEAHANSAGQPVLSLPQKRFPTPMRVDRKPSKRVLALLDGSRKLARKREQNASKQQNQAQQEGQAQKPTVARTQPVQTPQHFSRLKYETECKEQERLQTIREQQRVSSSSVLRSRFKLKPASHTVKYCSCPLILVSRLWLKRRDANNPVMQMLTTPLDSRPAIGSRVARLCRMDSQQCLPQIKCKLVKPLSIRTCLPTYQTEWRKIRRCRCLADLKLVCKGSNAWHRS